MRIQTVTHHDDLEIICKQMQPEQWGIDNDMAVFKPEKLRLFLEKNGILLLAFEGNKIIGDALCYVLRHPGGEDCLYIHELDTHPDFRRKGVGMALMQEVVKLSKKMDLEELWVATEQDNIAANSLYESLKPTEKEMSVTYVYKATD